MPQDKLEKVQFNWERRQYIKPENPMTKEQEILAKLGHCLKHALQERLTISWHSVRTPIIRHNQSMWD